MNKHHETIESPQDEAIRAGIIKHISIAPREKPKAELEQFTLDSLGAMVVNMQKQIDALIMINNIRKLPSNQINRGDGE